LVKGIGVDIIEIARIRHGVENSGTPFLERIFTQAEIDYCNSKHNRYQHLAARFAAKESVSKALSTGLRGEFGWKDIEVTNDPLGKPFVVVHGPLEQKLNGASIHLSISHSETHVVAMVVIEETEKR